LPFSSAVGRVRSLGPVHTGGVGRDWALKICLMEINLLEEPRPSIRKRMLDDAAVALRTDNLDRIESSWPKRGPEHVRRIGKLSVRPPGERPGPKAPALRKLRWKDNRTTVGPIYIRRIRRNGYDAAVRQLCAWSAGLPGRVESSYTGSISVSTGDRPIKVNPNDGNRA
jgi:hypothetical protein